MCSLVRALSAHMHKVWMMMKTDQMLFFRFTRVCCMSVTSTIETFF